MTRYEKGRAEPASAAPKPNAAMVGMEPDRRRIRFVVLLLSLPLILGFVSLGIWQIERRAWKLDLIERVESRIHAPAVAAPARLEWPNVTRENDEYRHISLVGTYRHDKETLVQALTERGSGFWVMTPLQQDDGAITLINRGYVPIEKADPSNRTDGQITGRVEVAGLLRFSEPNGGMLRSNDPVADRWYSRDLSAISEQRNLTGVAPYFVDADASSMPGGYPVGGLTVVQFNNNHLVYALTWFALASMLVAAVIYTWRHDSRNSSLSD